MRCRAGYNLPLSVGFAIGLAALTRPIAWLYFAAVGFQRQRSGDYAIGSFGAAVAAAVTTPWLLRNRLVLGLDPDDDAWRLHPLARAERGLLRRGCHGGPRHLARGKFPSMDGAESHCDSRHVWRSKQIAMRSGVAMDARQSREIAGQHGTSCSVILVLAPNYGPLWGRLACTFVWRSFSVGDCRPDRTNVLANARGTFRWHSLCLLCATPFIE